ncbi:soluble aldose sugar dehydrogenase yliI [Lysobacter antibioticus]|uniref:Aldose sugar dehydrogenase n=1 Tax=Lysobacter antibioticus TaxID=84531 RepID=A0A0S2DVR4_LYSAN|nr:PQQ-dependent sugar dehydrogenase [Lysobacter antibioticus]ALN62542.1 soluble aldose sugar dehydrogenase yliI [Lysobacter antibioticus]ALN80306.1 aldose sugar dehydrogenase [Lysobacter antibioticus]
MTPMLHRSVLSLALLLSLAACQRNQEAEAATAKAAPAQQATHQLNSELGEVRVTEIASGLEHPWAVALLPDGGFLVTERAGRLRRIGADGAISAPIAGVPAVWAEGQGGLLDVVLSPDFASSQRIYLSYAEPGDDGSAGTAVASATLGDAALADVKVIYQQQPKLVGPNHFGSRLAFDKQGHIFITQGERQQRMASQELDKLQGKLVRLNLDGSVPEDNPFVGRQDARPEIWSYGHRNMQSLAVDPRTGTVWEAEHGPRGGDEINLPQPGKNYGWPLITHGIDYSGLKISEAEGKEKPGLESPYHVWEKSPALSGMAFYTGHAGSPWNDSLFLGALADGSLIRLSLDGDKIVKEERLLKQLDWRIRDVRVSGDGKVYVLTDESEGKLLRLEPPAGK